MTDMLKTVYPLKLRFAGGITKWHVCLAKTQISLGICPVWSESSLCTQWIAKGPRFLHGDSKDSDQTGQMPRLILVFIRRTGHFVGFVLLQFWVLLGCATTKVSFLTTWFICSIMVTQRVFKKSGLLLKLYKLLLHVIPPKLIQAVYQGNQQQKQHLYHWHSPL